MQYIGEELELFERATNWRAYWVTKIKKYISGNVLEVGTGIGSSALALIDQSTTWTGLEPDPELITIAEKRLKKAGWHPTILTATVQELSERSTFDTVIYIDVLEHIKDDIGELRNAAKHLNPGGRLVVLSPAHQWLYSPFDEKIGHFRRYNIGTLSTLNPPSLSLVEARYLDSAGMFLSMANRLLLRQNLPTEVQINTWDRFVVPISRFLDKLTRYHLGKTVIAIWEKPA